MARVSQTASFENELSSTCNAFFRTFGLAAILKRTGAHKTKGFPAATIFQRLFALAFAHKTMFRESVSSPSPDICKDAFYRFVNSCRINWMRFTTLLAAVVVNNAIKPLTDESRVNVFIVDDTLYERNRSKKVELLSKVYDHCAKVYTRGFRLLTLGFSDGNTFVPVNSCLLASAAAEKRFQEAKQVDKRTCGYKLRQLAQTSAPAVMLEMIQQALDAGLSASYVLFDSWFSFPCNILAIKEKGLDVIARVKKTPKVHYRYRGEMLFVSKIYQGNKKRRGRSKYLLSVAIDVCDKERTKSIPAKLVYVRNRNKAKEYIVLLSTDVSLSEDEIIRIYGKRWDIEVFFKVCKSFLRLTKECSSLSYDAMTAYVAVVFARYTMLALENRTQKDDRTLGALFYATCDELSDITLVEAFTLLTKAFLDTVVEKLFLTSKELESLLESFMSKLPKTLKSKLQMCA